MMSDTPLIAAWRGHIVKRAAGLHLVDTAHPLQIFTGVTDDGSPRMVVRTGAKPTRPTLSNVVRVERYEDQGGKWNLSFTLQDRKFEEVFLRLADDVYARSAAAHNEATALDRVSVVFDEWRRLLKPRPSSLLSMEELRGLVGELYLLDKLSATRSMEAAVEGWLGPMGLPQDFWYPDLGYREAKAIGPSMTHVRISSEHQLDAVDLELVVLRIANTDDQTAGAVNLPTLVNRARVKLSDSGASPDPFEERLVRLGVDLSETFYEDSWFTVTKLTWYRVGDGFPSILASGLPTGVSRVAYQIQLIDLDAFKVDEMAVA